MPHDSPDPSPWVRRHVALFRERARVLDLASGRGRHARYLAEQGHDVLAVDRDAEALGTIAGVPGIRTRVVDLEGGAWPLAGERFDAIVVTNYLHRPSFDAMLDALADDGVLLYETFAAGNEAFGRPSNPDFLLATGELLERVRGRLAVVAFEEGLVERDGGRAVVQRLAAVGSRRRGPWPLP
ncbi:demethylmenaquinone methyltransferase / 2-methoxy-6-polyprenyl-1,4-benzoquinol methylase [Burkholderiales bacterium]|nr:demethylmenaquinone methyltransferase / 2-methoxy-6-polyprenyl-1,4-benzoquinol methylase [Burkholderiales bacterium]